jgi:hypothetical protein
MVQHSTALLGSAYWASSFNDSLLTYLDSLPQECYFADDVWIVSQVEVALNISVENVPTTEP